MKSYEELVEELKTLIEDRRILKESFPNIYTRMEERLDEIQIELEHDLQHRLGLESGDYNNLYKKLKEDGIDLG